MRSTELTELTVWISNGGFYPDYKPRASVGSDSPMKIHEGHFCKFIPTSPVWTSSPWGNPCRCSWGSVPFCSASPQILCQPY